jgi:hypothetical protein
LIELAIVGTQPLGTQIYILEKGIERELSPPSRALFNGKCGRKNSKLFPTWET